MSRNIRGMLCAVVAAVALLAVSACGNPTSGTGAAVSQDSHHRQNGNDQERRLREIYEDSTPNTLERYAREKLHTPGEYVRSLSSAIISGTGRLPIPQNVDPSHSYAVMYVCRPAANTPFSIELQRGKDTQHILTSEGCAMSGVEMVSFPASKFPDAQYVRFAAANENMTFTVVVHEVKAWD